MKYKLYIVLFLLMLPFTGLAQNDTIVKKNDSFNNQIDLDIHFLAAEFTYKRRVSEKLFVGASVSGGALYRMNGRGTFIELIKGKVLVEYQISNNFYLIPGIAYSLAFLATDDSAGYLLGLEMGLFYRLRKVRIGLEPSLVVFRPLSSKTYIYNHGIIIPLLTIKIPLKKW